MTSEAADDERPPRAPRDELHELVAAARALLEWHADAGSVGLPAAPPRVPVAVAPAAVAPAAVAPVAERAVAERAIPDRVVPERAVARPEPRRIEPARAPEPHGQPPREEARRAGDRPLDPAARVARLEVMQHEVSQCARCPLHGHRTQTVFARGNPAAELMFVGEGPGQDEDEQGLPFVGKAGQLLDRMIVAMGYAPADVYVANVVKCRPPMNRKPEPGEIASCVGYLHEQIALVRPKMLVALGATAVEGLLEQTGIMRLRGTFRLYRGQIPVMPTFHPAYLLRTPDAKREVWSDLKQVMAKLGKAPTK